MHEDSNCIQRLWCLYQHNTPGLDMVDWFCLMPVQHGGLVLLDSTQHQSQHGGPVLLDSNAMPNPNMVDRFCWTPCNTWSKHGGPVCWTPCSPHGSRVCCAVHNIIPSVLNQNAIVVPQLSMSSFIKQSMCLHLDFSKLVSQHSYVVILKLYHKFYSTLLLWVLLRLPHSSKAVRKLQMMY